MTFKEVQMIIDAFINKEKNKQQLVQVVLYNNAYLTSMFVGHVLGGKSIPKYEDIFKEELQQGPNDDSLEDSILADRLRDFARNANKQRKQQEELTCQKF